MSQSASASSAPGTGDRRTRSGAPGLRSDAQRSIAKILAAAEDCLAADPGASMTAIAAAAQVSRVTLYLHFPTREELIGAAVAALADEIDRMLADEPLESLPPAESLERTVRTAWVPLARFHAFVASCTRRHGDIVAEHDHVVRERIRAVLRRGRELGSFRSDQPLEWQVVICHDLLGSAASQVDSGLLTTDEAVEALVATLQAAYRAT
jgi:TetR/AcrR family transcriptional regulator, mexCD-oprJ operon repressor